MDYKSICAAIRAASYCLDDQQQELQEAVGVAMANDGAPEEDQKQVAEVAAALWNFGLKVRGNSNSES